MVQIHPPLFSEDLVQVLKMKRSVSFATVIFLFILSSPALALWYFDAESVTIDLDISSSIDIDRPPGSSLDYVTANVSFVPMGVQPQSIVSISADPEPHDIDGSTYIFRWDSPVPPDPSYSIDARVRVDNTFHDVRKIAFPYDGFSDDVARYTLPGENVDSDHHMVVEKASELAAGEDDYYSVVFRMADWVKENVEYDLSTANIKASRKASWVLARKDGVCDEITTLFMALLRAVGIPSRFVSGIAYTESPDFPENWGAHGWAEVYFPGSGWVPFDVTYGQYGDVDPTHIKLKESFDSAEPDTRYEWLGRDVKVVASPISVSADLVRHVGFVPDHIDISVDMLQDEVGIGSYNLVEATVTNRKDSYVSDFLFLARINELEVVGNNYQAIMLGPGETSTFYWVVKVIGSLDSHYTYTFPMTVANLRNTSADSAFYVIPGATVFSREDMERVVDAAMKEREKVFSKRLEVNCSRLKETYYTYDDPDVECNVKNTGNFPFKSLVFCFEDECRTADLLISQEKVFSYTLHGPDAGINKVGLSIEGDEVSKTVFYDVDVLDEPDVSVDDIEYPPQLGFAQPYTVAFSLKKDSSSVPQEVLLEFDAAGIHKEVDVGEMKTDKKFLFNLDSGDLSTKPNIFTIAVAYEDLNGKVYTEVEEFSISLVNVTFSQRVVIWVHDLDRWLRNLFK